MCIEPPRARFVPSSRPSSSAIIRETAPPFAITWPWPRCVLVITSSRPRAAQTPTATASCPPYPAVTPLISFALTSSTTDSSKRLIRRMRRYGSSAMRLLHERGGMLGRLPGEHADDVLRRRGEEPTERLLREGRRVRRRDDVRMLDERA